MGTLKKEMGKISATDLELLIIGIYEKEYTGGKYRQDNQIAGMW